MNLSSASFSICDWLGAICHGCMEVLIAEVCGFFESAVAPLRNGDNYQLFSRTRRRTRVFRVLQFVRLKND